MTHLHQARAILRVSQMQEKPPRKAQILHAQGQRADLMQICLGKRGAAPVCRCFVPRKAQIKWQPARLGGQ